MTAQEKDRIECAIRHIQTAVDVDPWAVEIAVEAMKAQLSAEDTTSDCISRQAAIEAMSESLKRVFPEHRQIAEKCLNVLPSAQPQPQWIPVSERLPEDDTLMLVNYIDHRPDAMDIWIGWHEMENVWYIDGEAHSREFGNEVVAWMPLPEPYQEESV